MEERKKSFLEYRFPLVIKPWKIYYVIIFVLVFTNIVLYGFAYFDKMDLDGLMCVIMFSVSNITLPVILFFIVYPYEFYIKLSDDAIKIKKLFQKDFTIRYQNIKSLSFDIEMVNAHYIDVPNTFMTIVSNSDDSIKFNISYLSDKMKGLIVEILYIKNPRIELNQIAINMKRGEYKGYKQVLDKTSYAAMVVGIIVLMIVVVFKLFLKIFLKNIR